MGGTRFKGLDVSRIPDEDYRRLQPRMIAAFAAIGIETRAPRSLPGKTSHGDMDLVASEESLLAHAGEARDDLTPRAAAIRNIGRLIGAAATASTGPLDHATSFAMPTDDGRLFQVDLITHPEATVDYALRFYSWGDTGALLSATARAMGLRNKATGLHYIAGPSRDQLDIQLPVTFDEALEILGLDARTHALGFADQDEVFAWLASGSQFDPRIYDASYLTERNRRRSRVRPMQVAFQSLCEGIETGNARHPLRYEGQSDDERYAAMEPYRERIRTMFPSIVPIESEHMARFEEKRRARDFYSSELLTDLTGLVGEELKLLMWQLSKDRRLGEMVRTRNSRMLAEMVSDALAWGEAVRMTSGDDGAVLHELVWEVTKDPAFGSHVLDLPEGRLEQIIDNARAAIAERAARAAEVLESQ